MTERMNRRKFLAGALAAGGGLVLSTGLLRGLAGRSTVALAAAAELADRHFIFCYFSGGWDLLISLDPRDPAVFREDLKKVTRIQPGYHLLPPDRRDLVPTAVPGMVFGPFIGGLTRHADKLAVVRGMSMDTLTHEVGRRRFLTGKPPVGLQAKGSSMATVLAARLGEEVPIPNLSVGVESYNDGEPAFASAIRVGSVTDLVRALRPGAVAMGPNERNAVDELLAEFRAKTQSAVHSYSVDSAFAAQDLVDRGLHTLFEGIGGDDPTSGQAQAQMAVTALVSGISRVVSINAATDLDAHGPAWAYDHGPKLEVGFDVVADMIDDLAALEYKDTGDSWLDHTTVVCFSEFGRTALVNSSGGRDHSLTNACFLLGAGVRGGQVIGRSSDVGMSPVGTDLVTGQGDPDGGIIVKPEHVHRALLHSVGITDDIVDLRADPLSALLV